MCDNNFLINDNNHIEMVRANPHEVVKTKQKQKSNSSINKESIYIFN